MALVRNALRTSERLGRDRPSSRLLRLSAVFGVAISYLGAVSTFYVSFVRSTPPTLTQEALGPITFFTGIFIFVGMTIVASWMDERRRKISLLRVETRARAHPDRPELAWDLARSKLESYLDRNLSQLRWIFWLTLIVMSFGFGLIFSGLSRAYDRPDTLLVSIVSSASGILVSFIGGSFLLIYRSILTQARRYVTVLERINAVGMAVQVLGSISDDNKDLRHASTARLAERLIGIYAVIDDPEHEKPPGKRRTAAIRGDAGL